jgi:hypothetical protein
LEAERARREAELERLEELDHAAVQELVKDINAIKADLGRNPKDETELVELRGKPMPVYHDDGVPRPIVYSYQEGDVSYTLEFYWD